MFRVFRTISAFYQNVVKIQVTQSYFLKYLWCYLYTKRESIKLIQTFSVIIVKTFVHFISNCICRYSSDKSNLENIFHPFDFANISPGLSKE